MAGQCSKSVGEHNKNHICQSFTLFVEGEVGISLNLWHSQWDSRLTQ